MKKIIAFLLVAIMALSLAACGEKETPNTPDNNNNPSQTQSGDNNGNKSGTEIKDINTENWEEVVKNNFNLDLSLPDGWSVASAVSPNQVNNTSIFFVPGGSTTYEDFGNTLFEQIQTNFTNSVKSILDSSVDYSSFEDANVYGAGSVGISAKDTSGRTITVRYVDNESTIELAIGRMGSWE